MYNFTPYNSFIGGIIIGLSVILFFLTMGRLAGISGIFANAIISKSNRFNNILFLAGLVIGPFLYNYFTNAKIVFEVTNSLILILIGGFLVGLGTKMSSGCTSGHGICGVSRLSIRSIVATITFIISGIFTVYILQLYGIHL